ncbi:hypothetical protein PV11_01808 [Exophiala sideris]|uniref:Uncharacterized protein n=1 Tax=Exophiala sideris TaxID=1016849 RepID=A0A0D1ZH83_9EURO|nr:hypothetical protein PV11_01808 [Exophiala sideris]
MADTLSRVLGCALGIILLSYTPDGNGSNVLSSLMTPRTPQAAIELSKRIDRLPTLEAERYAADIERLETLKKRIDKLEEQKNRRYSWMWADTKSGTKKD